MTQEAHVRPAFPGRYGPKMAGTGTPESPPCIATRLRRVWGGKPVFSRFAPGRRYKRTGLTGRLCLDSEKAINGRHHCLGQFPAPLVGEQQRLVLEIREIAELEQHRRYVRRGQHEE